MIGSHFSPMSRSAAAAATCIARPHHRPPSISAATLASGADETRALHRRCHFRPSQNSSAGSPPPTTSPVSSPPTTRCAKSEADAMQRRRRRRQRQYHEVAYDGFGSPPSSVLRYRRHPGDGDDDDDDDDVAAAALESRLNAPPPPLPDASTPAAARDRDGDGGTVRVEMLMAPITPADVNLIGGTYPAGKPESLPAVGGSQSVGIVTHSSSPGGSPLREGDMVVPSHPGIGTWRSAVVASPTNFLRVVMRPPRDLDPTLACHLNNAGTARNLLTNFVSTPLGGGDVVVQNGGASGVGFMAGQMASASGARVLSLVHRGGRTDEEFDALRGHLRGVGRADEVLAEEDAVADGGLLRGALSSLGGRAVLGLNCTGGPASAAVAKCLGRDGVMVTYGGMSMKPVVIPTGLLIFKNVQVKGYWHTAWGDGRCREEREELIAEVATMMQEGKLVPPGFTIGPTGAECCGRVFPLREMREALKWVEGGAPLDMESGMRRKAYFDCSEEEKD